MVVANPVYTNEQVQTLFTNSHYHGTVIWSWQQALLAAGLERQLRRKDLSAATKEVLRDGQRKLWQVIRTNKAVSNAELWTWSYRDGVFNIEPFGQRSEDKTESNAAQLWSTVYIAIADPELSNK